MIIGGTNNISGVDGESIENQAAHGIILGRSNTVTKHRACAFGKGNTVFTIYRNNIRS